MRTVVTLGQDLRPVLGHQHRVFELRAGATIFGANGPTVTFVAACVAGAGVDHRFNREAHAGKQSIDATLTIGKVRDGGIEMELFANAVSDVFSDD